VGGVWVAQGVTIYGYHWHALWTDWLSPVPSANAWRPRRFSAAFHCYHLAPSRRHQNTMLSLTACLSKKKKRTLLHRRNPPDGLSDRLMAVVVGHLHRPMEGNSLENFAPRLLVLPLTCDRWRSIKRLLADRLHLGRCRPFRWSQGESMKPLQGLASSARFMAAVFYLVACHAHHLGRWTGKNISPVGCGLLHFILIGPLNETLSIGHQWTRHRPSSISPKSAMERLLIFPGEFSHESTRGCH
jgi:hypothetical protein